MECPCRYCEKKGCGAYHSQCEDYKLFQAEREAIRHQKRLDGEYPFSVKKRRKRNGKS